MNTLALALWIAVLLSTLALALGLRHSRRRHGADGVLHDLTEAAFLAGGPRRVVDTALVALCQDGRMMIGGPGIVQVRSGARATDPVERAVLRAQEAAPHGALAALRFAVMRDPAVQETGDGLAARGLLAAPGAGTPWRRWGLVQALVCLLLVPVSFALTVVQWASADTYEFDVPLFALAAPALFLGLIAGLVLRAAAGKRLTAAGKTALDGYRRAHLTSSDLAVRTALMGPRALPDPLLRMQLMAFPMPGGRARSGSGGGTGRSAHHSCGSSGFEAPVMWCASGDGGGGSGGSGCGSSGSGCGSSGSGCGSSGSGCGSSGSSCGSSGSSCGSSSSSCSSGSSCGSSSGSSCGSSSS
ncbi:TIGR04222 domain-containing membrane protein [Streptomyces sp. NPDC089919]|uniref:TIGR04222 domain-containing membrane protein n=1 Tax=Streptomyces sp. NPDC089919 TaxID=3155188 RepID=UPI0034473051